jgi:hypothetical protein
MLLCGIAMSRCSAKPDQRWFALASFSTVSASSGSSSSSSSSEASSSRDPFDVISYFAAGNISVGFGPRSNFATARCKIG